MCIHNMILKDYRNKKPANLVCQATLNVDGVCILQGDSELPGVVFSVPSFWRGITTNINLDARGYQEKKLYSSIENIMLCMSLKSAGDMVNKWIHKKQLKLWTQ